MFEATDAVVTQEASRNLVASAHILFRVLLNPVPSLTNSSPPYFPVDGHTVNATGNGSTLSNAPKWSLPIRCTSRASSVILTPTHKFLQDTRRGAVGKWGSGEVALFNLTAPRDREPPMLMAPPGNRGASQTAFRF